jgi:hypothetical protein
MQENQMFGGNFDRPQTRGLRHFRDVGVAKDTNLEFLPD